MTRLFAILFALLAFAASLARADPPFISGGDSSFVPGISSVQIGGDLYQPATLTLDNGGAVSTVRPAAATSTRGSRATRAGRKMLDDNAAAQQAATEQQQQNNNNNNNNNDGGVVIIQGEPYVKSEAPREVKHDLEQHNKIDEVGRRGEEAAAAAAPAEEAAETAVATSENESIAAAVHRAPAVGDRRAASPAHHHREVVAAAALGGGGGGGGGEAVGTHGENELPREAFKAHSEEVMKAHGGSSASKHSPLASKQPPVVDVGMQNKQMDSRRAHNGVLQGRKGA